MDIDHHPTDIAPAPAPAHRHRPRPIGPAATLAVLALMAVLVTGCSDDTEAADDPGAAAESVEVVAVDFAFEDLPERISTETVLTLRNDSNVEAHELVAYRLPDDIDGTAEEILELPDEVLENVFTGPPAMALVVSPDGEELALGDGTLPEPGRYLLFCGIPTGADPEEFMAAAAESEGPPDVAGGPPHFVHGMAATIEVTDP